MQTTPDSCPPKPAIEGKGYSQNVQAIQPSNPAKQLVQFVSLTRPAFPGISPRRAQNIFPDIVPYRGKAESRLRSGHPSPIDPRRLPPAAPPITAASATSSVGQGVVPPVAAVSPIVAAVSLRPSWWAWAVFLDHHHFIATRDALLPPCLFHNYSFHRPHFLPHNPNGCARAVILADLDGLGSPASLATIAPQVSKRLNGAESNPARTKRKDVPATVPPPICHNDALGILADGRAVGVHTGVEQPQEQDKARDGAQHNANDCTCGETVVGRAVGGGDDRWSALPGCEGEEAACDSPAWRGYGRSGGERGG